PLFRPLFGSFRDLLAALSQSGRPAWTGQEPSPYSRPRVQIPAPYDWEPWLTAEPAPDAPAPPQTDGDVDAPAPAEHCARIADKIGLLGRLDPARLMPGAPWHFHRMSPLLLPEERAVFEQDEGGRLPEAYAAFLMQVGNGGFGPTNGLLRLERSGGFWAAMRGSGDERFEGRLHRPFPHRTAWAPEAPDDVDDPRGDDYHAPGRVDGTAYLADLYAPGGAPVTAHVVVNGPEQGHVWVDHRVNGDGILPAVRRGPYSFLAW